jgi:hypothetical protein
MSLRLRALELHVPEFVARSALRRLFDATASAFGREAEDLGGLDRRALLERYASFTIRGAEQARRLSDLDAASHRSGRTRTPWAVRSVAGSASEREPSALRPRASPIG